MNIGIKYFKGRNSRKHKSIYTSYIAGIFSAIIVGMFFALATKNNFEGWIPYKNFGWIQYVIYILFIIYVFFLFVKIGKTLAPDAEEKYNFKINYVIGLLSSVITALLILYHSWGAKIIISLLAIVLYVIIHYSLVRIKKPR